MAIIKPTQGLFSLKQTNKIGDPNGLGNWALGWTRLGYKNNFAGYYQKRRGVRGPIIVRCRHYCAPQNPGTAEQARRASFAEGVAHWHTLTTGQKAVFEREAVYRQWSGFNLHQSRWLKGEIS